MRTRPSSSRIQPGDNLEQAGSALLIVLILLSVMAALLVSNAVVLRRLKVELQLLEEKQQRFWQAAAAGAPPSPAQCVSPRSPAVVNGPSCVPEGPLRIRRFECRERQTVKGTSRQGRPNGAGHPQGRPPAAPGLKCLTRWELPGCVAEPPFLRWTRSPSSPSSPSSPANSQSPIPNPCPNLAFPLHSQG
jgi:hypothetical protein